MAIGGMCVAVYVVMAMVMDAGIVMAAAIFIVLWVGWSFSRYIIMSFGAVLHRAIVSVAVEAAAAMYARVMVFGFMVNRLMAITMIIMTAAMLWNVPYTPLSILRVSRLLPCCPMYSSIMVACSSSR